VGGYCRILTARLRFLPIYSTASLIRMETYHGYVRTPADAIKLFEACRLGLLPRVQRRLSEKERQSITSGSVFVWDEREAGMRRWTDGKSWSASRVSGSFLTYREMEGKRSTGFGGRRANTRSPEESRLDEEHDDGEPEGYRYKTDGLMKQSFSITTSNGNHLHLISYYSRPLPGAPDLPQPSTDHQLRHITPAKGLYPDSSLHESANPALTRAPMPSYSSGNVYTQHDQGAYNPWGPPAWMGPWPGSPNQGYRAHHPAEPEPVMPALPPSQPPRPQPLPPSGHPAYANGYERVTAPVVLPPSPASDGPLSAGPSSQQLQQAAARAVMIDESIASSAHNPHSPISMITNGHADGHANGLPSPRRQSQSPQLPSGPDSSRQHKASLSSILHPTPSTSGRNSAVTGGNRSGSSSPRSLAAAAHELSADAKALRSLDRKFCS